MEGSMNSLAFKGSIPDAINEARSQKKLFVVYISGEDEDSVHLEQSTWVDQNVAEVMRKFCVFLYLIQGKIEATQFSAIYPQKCTPSISAIGLNGVMLWQHEGYISAEDLKESIEKAWATLHVQETATTLLSAAAASRNPGSVHFTPTVPSTEASSSNSDMPIPPTPSKSKEGSRESQWTDSENLKESVKIEASYDKHCQTSEEVYAGSHDVEDAKTLEEKKLESDKGKDTLQDVPRDISATVNEGACTSLTQGKDKLDDSFATNSPSSTSGVAIDRGVSSKFMVEQEKLTHVTETPLTSSAAKSSTIQLSIRMPNGSSLQMKLSNADSLRSVKNFVDENQSSGIGSYDLAVPYPRKSFTEKDMDCTLTELGLASRQALIVVPNHQPKGASGTQLSSSSSSCDMSSSVSTSDGGYSGYFRKILSYMNPFSYFGGDPRSSSSDWLANDGSRQYGFNSGPRNNDGMAGASQRQFTADNRSQTPDDNAGKTRGSLPRAFGGNIHTLRHDDDQGPSDDRNTFWNGNSTQFGGDDKK